MELCGFFLFFFYRDLKNVPAAVIIWFCLRLLPKNKKVLGSCSYENKRTVEPMRRKKE